MAPLNSRPVAALLALRSPLSTSASQSPAAATAGLSEGTVEGAATGVSALPDIETKAGRARLNDMNKHPAIQPDDRYMRSVPADAVISSIPGAAEASHEAVYRTIAGCRTTQDRNSVVEGKRVSGRVEFGWGWT